MMKKDIRYISMSVAVAAFALASCSQFQEDNLFDENAALRVTHFNENLKSRLVTQSTDGNNGWVIQYFVAGSDEQTFEGFNLLGGFYENGKVTLASNHRFLRNGKANTYTESTSFYEMLQEEGPVLAFNIWNDVLTVFVDPVDPSSAPASLVSDGEGMRGDQNLVFQGFEGNNILFRGQRNSSTVRFLPCDRPWKQYIADTEATRNYITNSAISSYYVICGSDTLYFKDLRSGVITYCERVNDPLFPSTLNCVFSPTGFYLQHRNKIGGTSFQEFTLTEDKTCLMSENDSVQVIATWDNYIINHSDVWDLDATLFTEEQQSLYSQIASGVSTLNSKWLLKSIGMGRSTGKNAVNGLVITYYLDKAQAEKNPDKAKTNNAGLQLTLTRPRAKQMGINCTEENVVDNNLSVFTARGTAVESLMRQFAATLSGTYDMVPNDYFLPTSVRCIPVDGAGKEFKLGN